MKIASIIDEVEDRLSELSHHLSKKIRWKIAISKDRRKLADEIAAFAPADGNFIFRVRAAFQAWGQADVDSTKENPEWKKALRRKGDNPENDPTDAPLNAYFILRFDPRVQGTIRWNDYTKSIEIDGGPLAEHDSLDNTLSATQNWIAKEYGPTISRESLGHMIALVAEKNSYNPLHDYLFDLEHDGKPRIERLFIDYFGAEDTPHNRRIGKRFMIGALSRALPVETWCTAKGRKSKLGAKFDNIVVLEGAQGDQKTSAWEILSAGFYCSSSIKIADKDNKMLSSNWFVDAPEMASFNQAETNLVKAITTMRTDSYRAPYGRGIVHVPRHCVNIASTNDEQYLPDRTGNRRYWCVRCTKIDLEALMRDLDQLWAEAVAIYLAEMDCPDCHRSTDTVAGQRPRCAEHRWWLDKEEEAAAEADRASRVQDLPIKDVIQKWWTDMSITYRPRTLTTAHVAEKALSVPANRLTDRGLATSIGFAMKELGFKRSQTGTGKNKRWVYTPGAELLGMEETGETKNMVKK